MIPVRHSASDACIEDIYKLIVTSFAYMDTRIDPPSSIHQMTVDDIRAKCQEEELWSIGNPPQACVIFTHRRDCFYIGKLAVDELHRGKGHARTLIDLAVTRAKERGYNCLELETRVELTENRSAFEKLNFVKTDETAHEGYSQATSITMQRRI
jgi:GNAT superfamily N-acetyltransferase